MPERKNNNRKPLLHRPKNNNLNDLNWAPNSSEKLAQRIRVQIEKKSSDVAIAVRVLSIFFCAAGGTIDVNPKHPETDACAKKLSELPNEERFDYLKHLFLELGAFLTREPYLSTGMAMGKIFVVCDENESPEAIAEAIDSILAEFRSILQEELRRLDVVVN